MTATTLTINTKSSKLTSACNTNRQPDRLVSRLITNHNNSHSHYNPNIHHHRSCTKKLYPHHQQPIALGSINTPRTNHHLSLSPSNPIHFTTNSIPALSSPVPSPSIEHWASLSQRIINFSSADQHPSRHHTSSTPFTSSSSPSPSPSSSFPSQLHQPSPPLEPSPRLPLTHPKTSPHSSTRLLSFPTISLPTPFAFHFPLPTPARHLPPPHPGPRTVISIQSQPHSHTGNRRPTTNQAHPSFWPSTPTFSLPPTLSRRKRRAHQHPVHPIRLKKIKLAHTFFRSARLFHPIDYPRCVRVQNPIPSCISKQSSHTYRIMECPRWLHTSAAVEGHSSKLCPKESQFKGNAESWCAPSSFKFSTAQLSSPPQSASAEAPPRASRNIPPAHSHAAPLKAQLLAVLRLRSTLQPGEAALRLKKWVIWNSWVRGHAQRRFYPITNSTCGSVLTTLNTHATLPINSPGDEWTGDEIFDDNGDLVCEDEDHDDSEEVKNNCCPAPVAIAQPDTLNPENNEPIKSPRIIRSKLPPRIDTSKYPSNLTPPSSPESQSIHDDEDKLENDCCKTTVVVTNLLGQIKVSKVDSKPLTPPPSPPNQTLK